MCGPTTSHQSIVDGGDDAPALPRADVGIAIGSDTDVPIESEDINLVENYSRDVEGPIGRPTTSDRTLEDHLVWATGDTIFALPLAAGLVAPGGIRLSPAIGAVFMPMSTVVVAVNARCLRGVDLA